MDENEEELTRKENAFEQSNNSVEEIDKIQNSKENNRQNLEEIQFLKDYVERLQNELSYYQANISQHKTNDDINSGKKCCIELPKWMLSSNVMSPLFQAYDRRINELMILLDQQGLQLTALSNTTKELVQENQEMRNKMIKYQKMEQNFRSVEPACFGTHRNAFDETYEDCAQQGPEHRQQYQAESTINQITNPKLLVSENNLLTQQTDILTSELKIAYKEISNKDKHLSQLSNNITESTNKVLELENMLNSAQREKKSCEYALVNKNSEAGDWKNKANDLKQNLTKKNQIEMNLNGHLEELRIEKKELENETGVLTSRIGISFERIKTIDKQLSTEIHKNGKLAEQNTSLSINLDRAQKENEQMDNIVEKMDTQIHDLKAQCESLKHSSQNYQTKVEEITMVHGKQSARVKELNMHLERQRKDHQAQVKELTNHEHEIWQEMQNTLRQQIQAKELESKEKVQQIAKLQHENDYYQRDNRNILNKYNTLKNIQEEQKNNNQQTVEEWKNLIISASVLSDKEELKKKEIEAKYETLQQSLVKYKKDLSYWQNVLEKERFCSEAKSKESRRVSITLENEKEKLKQELKSLTESFALQEFQYHSKIHSRDLEYSLKTQELEIKLEETKEAASQNEEKVKKLKDSHGKEFKALTTVQIDMVKRLENQFNHEKKASRNLDSINKDLKLELEKIKLERKKCLTELSQEKERVVNLEHHMKKAIASQKELEAQFSEKLEEIRVCGSHERRLKSDLRKTQLELDMITIRKETNL